MHRTIYLLVLLFVAAFAAPVEDIKGKGKATGKEHNPRAPSPRPAAKGRWANGPPTGIPQPVNYPQGNPNSNPQGHPQGNPNHNPQGHREGSPESRIPRRPPSPRPPQGREQPQALASSSTHPAGGFDKHNHPPFKQGDIVGVRPGEYETKPRVGHSLSQVSKTILI